MRARMGRRDRSDATKRFVGSDQLLLGEGECQGARRLKTAAGSSI